MNLKKRAFIFSMVAILTFSMILIALWYNNFEQEENSIPIAIACLSVIALAFVYSAFNGRIDHFREEKMEQSEYWQIPNRGVAMKRMYPISWKLGSHINKFEFINDNRAGLRKERWKERRLQTVNEPLQKAHSNVCPRCGGSAGRVCPCKYRSKY